MDQGGGFQPTTSASPGHDLAGNLTQDGKGRSFTYDAENMLRAVNDNGSLLAEYAYGADATRRTKTVHSNSTVSHFWYSETFVPNEEDGNFIGQEILETSASGSVVRRYVRFPGSIDEAFLMLDYSANQNDPIEV